MLEDALLGELILTFALALAVIVALARLHVPHIVALIATGAIAGPGGIGIVRTQADVQTLAEIGIVLLLFTVGLDFSLGDFRRLWTRASSAAASSRSASRPWRCSLSSPPRPTAPCSQAFSSACLSRFPARPSSSRG